MKKVFFGNSGAEANECAIKVARKWAAENKGTEYNVIVTLVNSFHGRTLTTLAATGQEVFHKHFQPLTPGFAYVEAGNVEMLKKGCEEEKVAGILFECIQGEGGVNLIDPQWAKAAAKALFSGEIDDANLPVKEVTLANFINPERITAADLLVATKLCNSKNEARDAIKGGSVTVDGNVVDLAFAVTQEQLKESVTLKKGKKSYCKVVLK